MKTSIFIAIEGIDGTGKSTLASNLKGRLASEGYNVTLTFEPTNGAYGRLIRESFNYDKRLSLNEELTLFVKDRKEHVNKVILPALKQGNIVISDRYYLSTIAYQGARGADVLYVQRINEEFAPAPDIVFILMLPPEKAIERIVRKRGESPNLFENLSYLKRVDAIFRSIKGEYIKRLNALNSPEAIADEAMQYITGHLLNRQSLQKADG